MSYDVVTSKPKGIYYESKTNDNELQLDNSIEIFDNSDASTVLNVSLLREDEKNVVGYHEHKPNRLKDDCSVCSEVTVSKEDFTKQNLTNDNEKVAGWLELSKLKLHDDEHNLKENFVFDNWLDGSSPLHSLLTQNIYRSKVFLLGIEPDAIEKRKPLDLISGYCYAGCKRFSEYSCIIWSHQDSCTLPLCHNCYGNNVEKELKLIFKFKIYIMDSNGMHTYVNVWKEQAEVFLGCSTKDFINNRWVQDTRMNFLKEISVWGSYYEEFTPLLDINLVCIEDSFFLLYSRLLASNKSSEEQNT